MLSALASRVVVVVVAVRAGAGGASYALPVCWRVDRAGGPIGVGNRYDGAGAARHIGGGVFHAADNDQAVADHRGGAGWRRGVTAVNAAAGCGDVRAGAAAVVNGLMSSCGLSINLAELQHGGPSAGAQFVVGGHYCGGAVDLLLPAAQIPGQANCVTGADCCVGGRKLRDVGHRISGA